MKRFVMACAALGLFAGAAVARPPPNADMSLAPWFESLQQPGTGMSCCSIADCRQTDFRIQDGHYQALIEGQWRVVPPQVVLERMDNPTGRAVVCYSPYRGIMCFIKGPET
jgi:hypothetical protein